MPLPNAFELFGVDFVVDEVRGFVGAFFTAGYPCGLPCVFVGWVEFDVRFARDEQSARECVVLRVLINQQRLMYAFTA